MYVRKKLLTLAFSHYDAVLVYQVSETYSIPRPCEVM